MMVFGISFVIFWGDILGGKALTTDPWKMKNEDVRYVSANKGDTSKEERGGSIYYYVV